MSLIGLLILLIVFGVVIWAARALLAAFALGEPITTVVYVLIVLIAVFAVLGQFGIIGGGPVIRLGHY